MTLPPIVVAYDGSDEARNAVVTAAGLFAGRTLFVVSVWEPGLAMTMPTQSDAQGLAYAPPPDPEAVAALDHIKDDHAHSLAEAGAQVARDLGATAEAVRVPDDSSPADTVLALAEQHRAAAVVVGTRGRGRVRSALFGSTSRTLLHHADCPVMVVRAAPPAPAARGSAD